MSRDEFKARLAEDLRGGCIVLNVTHREVADALHVAETTVSRWLSGVTAVGVYDLRMFRRFLRDRAAAQGLSAEGLAAEVQALREKAQALRDRVPV